jgi:hypothetical protein
MKPTNHVHQHMVEQLTFGAPAEQTTYLEAKMQFSNLGCSGA